MLLKLTRPRTALTVLLLLGVIACCLQYLVAKVLFEVAHGDLPCFATKETRSNVLHMVTSFDQAMAASNLSRWIDHGTLLGSLLFADFIPWDHDGDMAYLYKDAPVVNTIVRRKLEAKGIAVKNDDKLVQLVFNGTRVDVFAYGTYADLKRPLPEGFANSTFTRMYLRNSDFFEQNYQDFQSHLVFPLHQCVIGDSTVSCPKDPRRLLKGRYPYSYWLPFLVPYKLNCYLRPWNLVPIVLSPKKLQLSLGLLESRSVLVAERS